jgi:hypothetical protein
MNGKHDVPSQHDPLDAAWRATSDETPSPALDDAIRAAARRTAGSHPSALDAPRTKRKPGSAHWWPLAAAAAIGVIAFGIVQVTPDEVRSPVSGTITDVPPASSAARDKAAQPAAPSTVQDGTSSQAGAGKQEAASDAGTSTSPLSPAPATPGSPPLPRAAAPAASSAASPALQARHDANADRAAGASSRNEAAAKPAPSAFPQQAERKSVRSVDAMPAGENAERAPAAQGMAKIRPASPAPDSAPAAAGSTAAGAAAGAPAPARAPAAMPAPAPAPVEAPASMSADTTEARTAASSLASAPPAARARAESVAGTRTAASAPAAASPPAFEDWIARIRELVREGRTADAQRELKRLRETYPARRDDIPAELRALPPPSDAR